MKIKYIHVSNLDSFARYDVKDAAAAFMDVLQSVGKTLNRAGIAGGSPS